MVARTFIITWCVILLVYVFNTDTISSKHFSCPEVCNCHLSRINWVTVCTNRNLTFVPYKGLDLDTRILNMNDNLLNVLEPFPSSIKVWTLQLANNLLTEIKKMTFDGLHHMLEVDLSNNLISHIDPYAFNNSKGLITIDLHGNPLEIDPVDGPFLFSKVLRNLNLANCHMTEIPPMFFVNISNLNTLDLSGNSLEVIKPNVFNSLKNLKHLILNDCNLTFITIEAFRGLEELSRLELVQNKLTIDVDWTLTLIYLNKLDYLDLRRAGEVQFATDAFSNSIWIRSLVLAENKLSTGLNVAITLGENLFHLEFLDLSYCDIKAPLSRNALARATNLRALMLSGNRLVSANLHANLSPLVKLEKLSLRDCGLNRLTKDTFKQLTHLKELDISENPLIENNGSLSFLSTLESLEYLDIGYNNLEEIPAMFFSKMSKLKTLILSGNKILYLKQSLFENLNGLQVLEINNCGLKSLNNILFFNNFKLYPNLVELRISRNPLQIPLEGSIFPYMPNLNNLDMSECFLRYLPEAFFILTPNLKQLLLNGNEFNGDEKDMVFMRYLTNIEELDLRFNNMMSISLNVFFHCNRLVSLKLIGNPWKCDCFIVDIWYWAATVKGNIAILEGSKIKNSHVKEKETYNLTCGHVPNITLNINPTKQSISSRPALNVNFTWQNYVNVSMCPFIY